jgi:hypothetical protein
LLFIGFHLFFMQNGGVNAISEDFKSAFGLLVALALDPGGYFGSGTAQADGGTPVQNRICVHSMPIM